MDTSSHSQHPEWCDSRRCHGLHVGEILEYPTISGAVISVKVMAFGNAVPDVHLLRRNDHQLAEEKVDNPRFLADVLDDVGAPDLAGALTAAAMIIEDEKAKRQRRETRGGVT